MTAAEIRELYPDLSEQGVANYVAIANRPSAPDFAVDLAIRKAQGTCLLQPDIEGGRPWTGWCLTHDVADTIDHHFEVHPDAYND